MANDFEALVVGGGSAGLSAALVLGRARIPTLVVDAGEPSNRVADAVGGLLGQHRTSPAELYRVGRAQIDELPCVELRSGSVTSIARLDGDQVAFEAELADGSTVTTSRVLLAGGMKYEVPEIDGLAALWGHSAFHCPYCHGWEHRDQRIAIMGGEGAVHRVTLLRSWTDDLVVASNGPLDAADAEAIRTGGVPLDERPIASVGQGLISFDDGDKLDADAFHIVPRTTFRDGLVAALGVQTEELPDGSRTVKAGDFGDTSAEGVFAAGDIRGPRNVAVAIGQGNLAATGLHRSLLFS